ncbi:hypothetical protein NL676_017708 [Syzygium grande]|nr:hypothetical protein NL676_017708 [Syzygium grande]
MAAAREALDVAGTALNEVIALIKAQQVLPIAWWKRLLSLRGPVPSQTVALTFDRSQPFGIFKPEWV